MLEIIQAGANSIAGVLSGYIFCTKENFAKEFSEETPENLQKAKENLIMEVGNYNEWANGDIYTYSIFAPDNQQID